MSGDRPGSSRNVVFVLGMHRSGTSALSRMLSLLGCDLPKTLMPESPDNARGYWESWPITHLNDAILASGGSHWDDWLPFNPDWYASPVHASFVKRGRAVLSDEFGDSPLFVLKDPRCARLVPYWVEVFAQESIRPLVLIPIRNPIEVAESITTRDHIHRDVVLLLWLRHVLDAEHDTRGLARAFTTYDKLLNNWTAVAVHLQDRFGIQWPGLSALAGTKVDEFLDPGIRHHEASPETVLANPLLARWLRDTFAIMLRWGGEGESAADFAKLDDIRRDFDAAGPAFAGITQALMHEASLAQDLQTSLAEETARVSDLNVEVSALRAAWEVTRGELADKESRLRAALEENSQSERSDAADGARLEAEAEAQALRDRLEQVEQMLREREAEIERVGAERALVSDRAEALEAGKREIEERLQAADEAVRGQRDALLANDQAAQRAESEIRDLQERLAYVENTLRQREEEIAQTGAENESAKARVDSLEAEKRKIEAKLEDADKWVLRLAEERQKAHARIALIEAEMRDKDRALKAARRDIQHADSRYQALEQRVAREHAKADTQRLATENLEANIPESRPAEVAIDARRDERFGETVTLSHMLLEHNGKIVTLADGHEARLERYVGEVDVLSRILLEQNAQVEVLAGSRATLESVAEDRRKEIERLQAIVREVGEANERKDREIVAIAGLLLEQQGAVESLSAKQAALNHLVDDRQQEIERWKGVVDEVRSSVDHKDQEILNLLQSSAATNKRLETSWSEIANLTSILAERESEANKVSRQAEWLKEVTLVMMRNRWWYKFATIDAINRRKHRLLRRKGLFDTDAYTARYPDVRQSDIDPLRHFIIHGIAENRVGLPEKYS